MTTDYYRSALQFMTNLRDALAELNPRDMLDVQGFCWGVFNHKRIWFGGKSYGGTQDMLPEFMARQVYAIGFARRSEIAMLLTGVPSLDKGTRSARRVELISKSEKKSERAALVNFFDLLSEPGSILLAKSTWYDKGLEQSLLKISGVCRTGDHVAFDEQLCSAFRVRLRRRDSSARALRGARPMSSREQDANTRIRDPEEVGINRHALEAATAADRQFFEANPQATERERALVPGETPFEPVPPGYVVRVLVTQIAPGFRLRAIFFRKVLHHGTEEQH